MRAKQFFPGGEVRRAVFLWLCATIGSVLPAGPHQGRFPAGYQGASSCLVCHPGKDTEVMGSVHYLWRSENPLVEYPGGGAHGMVDRACGLVGSNAIVNYYERCGKCHVGDTLPFPDPQTGQFTDQQKKNLDCLICHADSGMYDLNNDGIAEEGELAGNRALVYNAQQQRYVWYQDRSLRAAESVGGKVTTEACLRCHHHGQADYHYKRGTPYEPHTDVHAAMGMRCTVCHTVREHKIARGSRVTDMYAWELQDVEVSCENCHTETPHKTVTILNLHTERIACETCHIPRVAGAQRRVWAPTFGLTEGPESRIPTYDDNTGKWLPYSVYDEGLTAPSYRWFNGSASMLAEPVDQPWAFNMQPATAETPGAKITPFRNFVSGQPMDGRGIPGMPDFDPRFTMGAALAQMAPMLKQAGFMRAEGLTPAEEALMSQFPNMLMIDRSDYYTHGDLQAAVSIGMAKQAAFMQGMNIGGMSRDELIQMGVQFWSGKVVGLDLPDNPYESSYVADQDPTTVTGSFITVSHAVTRRNALSCGDCHTPNGRLDFAALGYSADRVPILTHLDWSMFAVCTDPPRMDANGDCKADLADFAILTGEWMQCGLEPREACGR